MDWNQVSKELQRKLDPKHVKEAPKGKFGSYVDGYHVITEANRIFGENGWSYRITELRMVSEQTVDSGRGPQYRVGYLCRVVVNVDGVEREGSAVGSGVGNPNTMADHHESAVKEAETDALKRALRTFGNTFGLALYDKTQANVGVDVPAKLTNPADTKAAIIAALMKRTEPAEVKLAWQSKTIQSVLPLLPEDMRMEVTALYEERAQIPASLPTGLAAE